MKTRLTFARFMIASSIALGLPLGADAFPMTDKPAGCSGPMLMRGEPGMFGGSHTPPFLRGLDLNESQRDRIFRLMHAQAPAMRNQAKAMHKSQMELRQLGLSGEYSEAKAQALAEASAGIMAKMAQMHARTDQLIYRILTPEQRKQLVERRARPQQIDMP